VSYWRLFYHFLWATREREPSIDEERATTLEKAIRAACNDADAIVHALTLMTEHVHLVASIPPKVAIADLMQRVKGMSSHLLNDLEGRGIRRFAWQGEYGVLSVGESALDDVIAYVRNQHEHHAKDTLISLYEITERPRPPANPSPGGAF
jgi:REP element-mobilizing transposase RayT